MSDFALVWKGTQADLSVGRAVLDAPLFEVGLSGAGDPIGGWEWVSPLTDDFARDDGLETAVLISLFTDRRAEDSDVLPDGITDRRGWWGDAFPRVDGDRYGSRLWLLGREKRIQATMDRAVEYAREALQWMLEDQISDQIDVAAEPVGKDGIGLIVQIRRPKTDSVKYRFNLTWAAQAKKAE